MMSMESSFLDELILHKTIIVNWKEVISCWPGSNSQLRKASGEGAIVVKEVGHVLGERPLLAGSSNIETSATTVARSVPPG